MRMSKKLEVLNFPLYPASHVAADELLPRNDLDRHLLVRNTMCSQLDLTKRSFSKCSYDMVGTDALFRLLLRYRFNRSVIVVILGSARTGIGRFVLGATVRRGRERDLE